MKRKSFSFLQSQITTLLTILAIAVITVCFIIVAKPYDNSEKLQYILVPNSYERFSDEVKRLERLRKLSDNTANLMGRNDIELKLTQSNCTQSKETGSGEICLKRLPQAIIVGIQKSGTTALLQFLNDHPQIRACLDPAETQYFSMHYSHSLDWYRNLMPCSYSNQITIEKSPPYFYRRFCAERIRKMNPKTKIIITVKDPITRAVSMYAMLREKKKNAGMSFEESISFNTRSIINENSRYIDFSNYPKYMQFWLDNFNLNQILVINGHNLEDNPAEELNRVENFLGITSYFTNDRFTFNETKGKYCLFSKESGTQCLNEKKGRKHPEINPKMRSILETYFRPKNKQFFEMIKMQFDWGY